jgi:predicted amidohydrolase
MKVTIIQSEIFWEDREKNLIHFESLIHQINEDTDLIVLPEMFTTGFSMDPKKVAEPMGGKTLKWLQQQANIKNCTITGSAAIDENGKYFNRLFWVEANGHYHTYDKRHLFRMAKEDEHYTAGEKTIITQLKNWHIKPLICYDLRFPVWSRNHFKKISNTSALAQYDVLIYIANWPEVRAYPWKQLLIARAIENQCYVIGVNRIGEDGNGFKHSGDSVVINPKGEIISKTKANEKSVETVILDRNYLDEYRKTFPVGLDADSFNIEMKNT